MSEISGYIERITFQNPENGYTVAKLQEIGKNDLTIVVGHLPSVQPGESVRCTGKWKNHLTHGWQFEIDSYKTETPADINGIKKYLGSGLIKGIGPVYAKRIVAKFGSETLMVIDSDPDKLLTVSGIGKKRIGTIKKCWEDQRVIREVMIFLQQYGISPSFAQKIFRAYGKDSIKKLKDNPYNLAKDIIGIGFRSADKVAFEMGIEKGAPKRIESGIEYVLSQLSGDGHVCFPLDEFLESAEDMLEVPKKLINESVDSLVKENRIVVFEMAHDGDLSKFIWIRPLFLAEVGIARQIRRLRLAPCNLREIDTQKAVEWVQRKLGIELAENQKLAVRQSMTEKVQVITGGPGTGKSTITNAILEITSQLTGDILLAAPTGRAAKRMTEITGKKALTIHSLLEFDFKIFGFKRNPENPLECDLLIVDEASMIDTLLMNSLLKAIPDHARVIFVGDINQLPSVGPGNVLKDIIASKQVSVTMLNEIFRQAAGSRIITNSHKINEGSFPDLSNHPTSDFFFVEAQEKEDVLDQIVSLVVHRLPKKYGYSAMEDIQVLSPMKKGVVGTENLNSVLQDA
ncbi:MAG: ATP-dependent RecD-like DNA helicase, partial [Chlamydiota bacterium]|nr:ATP-dependent RecD-like DNA helicase [Chlamydiota bacterium]